MLIYASIIRNSFISWLRLFDFLLTGAPGGIRTHNQQNRNLSFYPIELRVQCFYLVFNICYSIQLRRAELLSKQTTGAIYQSIKNAFEM